MGKDSFEYDDEESECFIDEETGGNIKKLPILSR